MELTKTNEKAMRVAMEIARVGSLLWEKGWAESGAGNISMDVTGFYGGISSDFRKLPKIPLKKTYKKLAGKYILITKKGSRMRDLAMEPGKNICIVKVGNKGTDYQLLFENEDNPNQPSSELSTHLAVQELLASGKSDEKAVLHTHPHELLSLTHIPEFRDEKRLNHLLWSMHTETVYFLPDGIGYVPYHMPGSAEIAEATYKALKKHRVVLWEKHGCLATGRDVVEAFDRIDILAKSARIYFICKNAGFTPEGLSDKQIAQIRRAIGKIY
jgi:rhamnulose-1-phosphate aldolase